MCMVTFKAHSYIHASLCYTDQRLLETKVKKSFYLRWEFIGDGSLHLTLWQKWNLSTLGESYTEKTSHMEPDECNNFHAKHTEETNLVQSRYGDNFTQNGNCKNSVHQMRTIRRISTLCSRQTSCAKVYFLFAGLQVEPTTRIAYPDPVTNLTIKAEVYNASRRLLQLVVSWIPPNGTLCNELSKYLSVKMSCSSPRP